VATKTRSEPNPPGALAWQDGGNRFALNVLFAVLVFVGSPVALIVYAIGRTRLRRVWATAVLVIPTLVWAAFLARHISMNHCFDPASVC
jgi:phage terminase large subunit-like protein